MFFALALILAGSAQAVQDGLIVTTKYGAVRGFVDPVSNSTRVFRGIPFAKAPIGDLRWREPQTCDPWTGVRDATSFGATCSQFYFERDGKVYPGWPSIQWVTNATEDCLFVNVYAPPPQNELLPVMVYIHAGEFQLGSSNDLENNAPPSNAVVFVTFNFRLSAFGFLAGDFLRERTQNGSVGNYGMLDQQFALKWVNENIEAFGGDPNRVTIFGESSGGTSVAYHLVSPSSWPYFQRAILESPGLTQTKPWENAIQNTRFVLDVLSFIAASPACASKSNDTQFETFPGQLSGRPILTLNGSNLAALVRQARAKCALLPTCFGFSYPNITESLRNGAPSYNVSLISSTYLWSAGGSNQVSDVKSGPVDKDVVLDCFLQATTQELVQASNSVPFGDTTSRDAWAPVVDGVALTGSLVDLIASGKFFPTGEVILGSNLDEGTIFMNLAPPIQCNATFADLQTFAIQLWGQQLGAQVAPLYTTLEDPVPICSSPRQAGSPSAKWDGHQAAMRAVGDWTVTCRVREAARALQRASHAVYMYMFKHQPIESVNYDNLPSLGAFHGAEVPFVLLDKFELASPAERSLSDTMSCYWTNFAISGDPNIASSPFCDTITGTYWPKYDSTDKNIEFDLTKDGSAVNVTVNAALRRAQCDLFAQQKS